MKQSNTTVPLPSGLPVSYLHSVSLPEQDITTMQGEYRHFVPLHEYDCACPSRWTGTGFISFNEGKLDPRKLDRVNLEKELAPFESQLRVVAQFGLSELHTLLVNLSGRVSSHPSRPLRYMTSQPKDTRYVDVARVNPDVSETSEPITISREDQRIAISGETVELQKFMGMSQSPIGVSPMDHSALDHKCDGLEQNYDAAVAAMMETLTCAIGRLIPRVKVMLSLATHIRSLYRIQQKTGAYRMLTMTAVGAWETWETSYKYSYSPKNANT